jgi:hypothetical protein
MPSADETPEGLVAALATRRAPRQESRPRGLIIDPRAITVEQGRSHDAGSTQRRPVSGERETRCQPSPECPARGRKVRTIACRRGGGRIHCFPGISPPLEAVYRTTENRGVPSSSVVARRAAVSIASGSDLRWPRPLVVVSYAPGSAREAELVTRAVRSTVRSIAGFPPRPGPSDTSEDPDGYGIYGTMGHCAPAGHQVEGLVRGFPGGGSSPLRRMSESPANAGLSCSISR